MDRSIGATKNQETKKRFWHENTKNSSTYGKSKHSLVILMYWNEPKVGNEITVSHIRILILVFSHAKILFLISSITFHTSIPSYSLFNL